MSQQSWQQQQQSSEEGEPSGPSAPTSSSMSSSTAAASSQRPTRRPPPGISLYPLTSPNAAGDTSGHHYDPNAPVFQPSASGTPTTPSFGGYNPAAPAFQPGGPRSAGPYRQHSASLGQYDMSEGMRGMSINTSGDYGIGAGPYSAAAVSRPPASPFYQQHQQQQPFSQSGNYGGQYQQQQQHYQHQQGYSRPPRPYRAAPPPISTGRQYPGAGPSSAAALEGVQFLWQAGQGGDYGRSRAQSASATAFPYATLTPTMATPADRNGPMTPSMMSEHSYGGGYASMTPLSAYPMEMPATGVPPIPQIRYTRNTAPLPIIPAHVAAFPRRPEPGTKGRSIRVRANFFEMLTLPGQDIHHYDIKITPEVPPSLNRKIFRQLVKLYSKEKLDGTAIVFDGRRNIYAPKALPIGEDDSLELEVTISDDPLGPMTLQESMPAAAMMKQVNPRKFSVRIRASSLIGMSKLNDFLNGRSLEAPVDAFQALDVLMRHRPSMLLSTVGRSFFTRNDAKLLGDGAECWMGFHQSMRPARGKLLVNIDVSATAFYEPGPLLTFVARNLGRREVSELKMFFKPREIDKCERLLKGVKVQVNHRGEMRRKYKIHGLTRTPADETLFKYQKLGEGGQPVGEERDISITEYFMTQYNLQLRFPFLPCLKVGNPQRTVFLPMEVCDIVAGQRYLRKLNEQQTAQMIRMTCQTPDRRANKIAQAVTELGISNKSSISSVSAAPISSEDVNFLANFGVRMSDEMTTLSARVLDPPTIQYHPTSREPLITPREGSWNLRDKKVVQPATLHAWSIVCFGNPRDMPQQKIDHFLREMISTCRDTGLIITNPHPPAIYADPMQNVEASLQMAWQAAGESVQSFPQLIMCILPNSGVPLYAEIKRVGDTVLGVPTQCLQAKHTFQPKKQYCANVCLKINTKLGGVNSFIVKNPSVMGDEGLPWVAEVPTIILGADITHPAHGEGKNSGSVCALVGSLDRLASRYAATVRLQPARKEVIMDLASMVAELLKIFYHENGQIAPQRILFYRDGLSESQFHEVVRLELAAIREACERVQSEYRPAITFIVVQKRHHARVFAMNPKDADRSGNIPAGTVIDTGITHPNEYDFYLCSHAGLQGTSRPTHYHVLHDENGFTSDSLHELTYRLCYGYARCTRSVSVVPPAYYADLVAFRAKYHMKGAEKSSSGTGSSFREDSSTGVTAAAADTKTVSSAEATVAGDYDDDLATGTSTSGDRKKRRKADQMSKEEEDALMKALQTKLAVVKPDLQKIMYFM